MKKLLTGRLPRQKLNIFLICLICSFMAWSVSKLSEIHTDDTSFILNFTEVPDSLFLDQASRKTLDVRVRANGFQFLGMQLSKRKLDINLTEVRQGASGYYLPATVVSSQIEGQLPASVDLIEVSTDTLYFNFLKVYSKKVPVVPDITLDLGQNHLLEGAIVLQPDSIILHGPNSQLDTIDAIGTRPVILRDITEDFNLNAALILPGNREYLTFSDSTVNMSGSVFRFSEKVIEVPVVVINIPDGTEIKTFPSALPLLCKARIEQLKDLDAADFRLVADYSTLRDPGQAFLEVQLAKKPEAVHSAILLEERIEFILKRPQ